MRRLALTPCTSDWRRKIRGVGVNGWRVAVFNELGSASIALVEFVFVKKDDKRVAIPDVDRDHNDPLTCIIWVQSFMFDVLVVLENKSQTFWQEDDEEFSPLLATLDPLQAHVSPLDHIRDNAYVRTSRGVNTLTTSPLIHVQDADNRIVEFEFAFIAGEKDAIPAYEATSLPNPSSDAILCIPNEFVAFRIDNEHLTEIDEIVDPEPSINFTAIAELGGLGESEFDDKKYIGKESVSSVQITVTIDVPIGK